MTEQTQPTDADLKERCAEIVEWQRTGVLPGNALRNYAEKHWAGHTDALQMAERDTSARAMELIAKWGTPAGAGEPDEQMIAEYGIKASRMMARDLTRFDAACEVDKYLREQGAPGYYRHRMSIILFGNVEGTEASRAPDTSDPQPTQAQAGAVVITTDPDTGQCVAVTRQDDEGRVLSVIWQAPEAQAGAVPLTEQQMDAIWEECKFDNGDEWSIHWTSAVRAAERLHGIKGADHA